MPLNKTCLVVKLLSLNVKLTNFPNSLVSNIKGRTFALTVNFPTEQINAYFFPKCIETSPRINSLWQWKLFQYIHLSLAWQTSYVNRHLRQNRNQVPTHSKRLTTVGIFSTLCLMKAPCLLGHRKNSQLPDYKDLL